MKEEKNYTLEDLKQKVINELCNSKVYNSFEIELLKTILDYEKNDLSKIKDLITQLQKQDSIF